MGRAGDGDRPLLHRLEQGRLRLGRGPVDLVGQNQVGEDRAALELEPAAALGRFEHDVGADQVGRHQVGCELDALKLELQRVGQRAHEQRLAQPGHALEQDVPAGDQGRQRVVDDLRRARRSPCRPRVGAIRSRSGTGRARDGLRRLHSLHSSLRSLPFGTTRSLIIKSVRIRRDVPGIPRMTGTRTIVKKHLAKRLTGVTWYMIERGSEGPYDGRVRVLIHSDSRLYGLA